jgi:hypothetical protein
MLSKACRVMLGLACLAVAGCHSVYVTEPIGSTPAKLDAGRIDGLWTWENGAMMVKTTDPEEGRLTLAWIEDEAGTLTMKMAAACVREHGGMPLLSMKDVEHADHPDRPEWVWLGAYEMEGDQGFLWIPDWKAIGERVRAGALPGTAKGDNDDVHLDKLTPAQMDTATTVGMLMWSRPFPLKRLDN